MRISEIQHAAQRDISANWEYRIALHRAHVLVDQAEACFSGHGLCKIYHFSQLLITSSFRSYDES